MDEQVNQWLPPPVRLSLVPDEVHVWRAQLDLPLAQVEQLRHSLTPDEVDRSDRFHFEKDRHHFIAGRGILRAILGSYLNAAPKQLRFSYNEYGKPFLNAGSEERPQINFNLSHSDGLALYGFVREREIGIDLERIRTNFEHEEIAARSFSPREVAVLGAVPPAMKALAFFHCWTRKEAYIKAQGQGLSLPLDSFDVSLVPGEPATLLATRDDPQEVSHWSLHDLAPGYGYAGALAVRGRNDMCGNSAERAYLLRRFDKMLKDNS